MISGGNNWEIGMFSPINYFSSQSSAFLAGKLSLQNKSRTNQVCAVRLIPGLQLFHFREYGPLSSVDMTKGKTRILLATTISFYLLNIVRETFLIV